MLGRRCAGSPASGNEVPHCDRQVSRFFEKVLGGTAVWADPAFRKILKLNAGVDSLRAVTDNRVVDVSTYSANPLLHDSSSLCRAVGKRKTLLYAQCTVKGFFLQAGKPHVVRRGFDS